MSKTFIIKPTSGSSGAFTIKPGALDGPGGLERHTDLRLYGLGIHEWGDGVGEDLYRLLENFSCPQKESGDYYAPRAAYDYNPSTDPVQPKSEHDIAPGYGITTPVLGQKWFNTSQDRTFVYTSTGWLPESGIHMSISFDNTGAVLKTTGGGSVTRNGTGDFTISFPNAGTTLYSISGSGSSSSSDTTVTPVDGTFATTSVRVLFKAAGIAYDPQQASVIITL